MANSKFKQLILGTQVRQDNRTYPPTMGGTPAGFIASGGTAMVNADIAYNPGVAYAEGDLLFYTDGATVFDSLGAVMNGGTVGGLDSQNTTAQTAVILKSPTAHYYWIITHNKTANAFYVHTVLMTGNSGRGSVTQKAVTINIGIGITNRFNAFYSTSTSQYGIICKRAGTDRWISYLITGLSGQNPTFGSAVYTDIGTIYADNDAANWACVKFNEDGTKMATVYQAAVGTSAAPVNTAIVEVYDFDPATGVPSAFNSFSININDAGPVTPGLGHDGRLKAYDLEFDFENGNFLGKGGFGEVKKCKS